MTEFHDLPTAIGDDDMFVRVVEAGDRSTVIDMWRGPTNPASSTDLPRAMPGDTIIVDSLSGGDTVIHVVPATAGWRKRLLASFRG